MGYKSPIFCIRCSENQGEVVKVDDMDLDMIESIQLCLESLDRDKNTYIVKCPVCGYQCNIFHGYDDIQTFLMFSREIERGRNKKDLRMEQRWDDYGDTEEDRHDQ